MLSRAVNSPEPNRNCRGQGSPARALLPKSAVAIRENEAQQTVAKAVKAIVAALRDAGILDIHIGFDHAVERFRMPHAADNRAIQQHLRVLFDENTRMSIRSLDSLAPRRPIQRGGQLRRNTEYPYHDAEGNWSYPAHDKAFSAEELRRFRAVARRAPWHEALPENQRIVFPGYANLREMSEARTQALQENIGSGFITYFRPSNIRMVFQQSRGYQEKTHANLDAALSRGDLFVAFLTTYPKLSINHTVLIYARKNNHYRDELERYFVYDPNHAEAPRELTWSPHERAFAYQKDIDFVGGFVRVYQAYGNWLQ